MLIIARNREHVSDQASHAKSSLASQNEAKPSKTNQVTSQIFQNKAKQTKRAKASKAKQTQQGRKAKQSKTSN